MKVIESSSQKMEDSLMISLTDAGTRKLVVLVKITKSFVQMARSMLMDEKLNFINVAFQRH
jgi:hypothetical protein